MNRFLALISLVGVLAFGLGVAGCGSDSGSSDGGSSSSSSSSSSSGGDDAAVRDVATKVGEYTVDRDAKAFCTLFAPGQLDQWIGKGRCVKVFAAGFKHGYEKSDFEIEEVKVDGDRASVKFKYGEVDFEKVDGNWYLETPEIDVPSGDGEQ